MTEEALAWAWKQDRDTMEESLTLIAIACFSERALSIDELVLYTRLPQEHVEAAIEGLQAQGLINGELRAVVL